MKASTVYKSLPCSKTLDSHITRVLGGRIITNKLKRIPNLDVPDRKFGFMVIGSMGYTFHLLINGGYSLGLKPTDPITFDPFTSTGDSIRDQTSSKDPPKASVTIHFTNNPQGHKLAELLGIFSPGGGNSSMSLDI